MWTTRWWKAVVICGSLAAQGALAKPTALEQPAEQAEVTREALDGNFLASELVELYPGAPDDMALPRLRHVEPVRCAAAPEGRLWVAATEECGETECIEKTTIWVGSWTVEDAGVTVACDAEHVVLSTHDWRMVLVPDGHGDFNVEESTLGEEPTSTSQQALAPTGER
ncbi:hypothetical protein NVS55_24955 [Myxococcus stipitatus]|uniref:hypothetical protein n=1 Tax=Myxococcus stipitatus TaxID=83455 RepID=UPI003144EEE8